MGNNMGWLGIAMMIVMAGFSTAFLVRAGQAAVRRTRGLRTRQPHARKIGQGSEPSAGTASRHAAGAAS